MRRLLGGCLRAPERTASWLMIEFRSVQRRMAIPAATIVEKGFDRVRLNSKRTKCLGERAEAMKQNRGIKLKS